MDSKKINDFQQSVLAWYKTNGRKLPWRETNDPYYIFVSEVMLQQTQVDRVIPKYYAWLQDYPTVGAVAESSLANLLRHWQGLGYNRRALFLQKACQAISRNGYFPTRYTALLALPGIGAYTAGAICAFAFNQDVSLIDTNIKRIFQLLELGDTSESTQRELTTVAENYLPTGRAKDWYNALMDIGAIISRYRTAQQQQEVLIQIFPILQNYSLPLVRNQPLKRPKQSDFKSSKRYLRGKIVDVLRHHDHLTIDRIKKILTEQAVVSQHSVEELVDQLTREGILERQSQYVQLSQR